MCTSLFGGGGGNKSAPAASAAAPAQTVPLLAQVDPNEQDPAAGDRRAKAARASAADGGSTVNRPILSSNASRGASILGVA